MFFLDSRSIAQPGYKWLIAGGFHQRDLSISTRAHVSRKQNLPPNTTKSHTVPDKKRCAT